MDKILSQQVPTDSEKLSRLAVWRQRLNNIICNRLLVSLLALIFYVALIRKTPGSGKYGIPLEYRVITRNLGSSVKHKTNQLLGSWLKAHKITLEF